LTVDSAREKLVRHPGGGLVAAESFRRQKMKSHPILVSLIIALLAATVAEAKYGGGSGTEQDPYLIYTSEQMNTIGANQDDWGKHFRLMADIDLSAYTGTQFNIIGRYFDSNDPRNKPFYGVFDGNNKRISNFTWTSYDINYVGLFGYLGGPGQIKNLGMENVNVKAGNGDDVGGLVGYNYSGTITNCYSTGKVLGTDDVGGLVGETLGGSLTDCYSASRVWGVDCVGGLVGENWGSTITDCYSTGGVSGTEYVGGLVGKNWWTTTGIAHCYSTGSVSAADRRVGGLVGDNYHSTITYCYSTGSVSGEIQVGGLVGENYSAMITDCYSTGSVSAGWNDGGGLVGYNGYDSVITDCYSTGNVTGHYSAVGGLVGQNVSTIIDCYSIGSVSGTTDVGGLVGLDSGGQIWDSFWDKQTSGQLTSAGGIPKTTDEMKTMNTFTNAGWDFVNVWHICEATNYPRLRWQILAGDFLCPYGIDFIDFAVLSLSWQSEPTDTNWNPACDVSQPKDNVISELDLAVFCENWLEER